MKITAKKPLNTQAESKSGIPSGDSSGDSSVKISSVEKENTNQQKARKIVELGYSKRSLSTLERLSAQELDFILREKRDPAPDEISKKSIESSKEIVKAYISTLEAIKQERAKEPLNKGLKTIAESQSGALGEFVGTQAGGRVGLALLIISAIALAIDSFLGFERLGLGKKPQPKTEGSKNEAK